jgi:hypothetical protein
MSNVWFVIPSARPPAEAQACFQKWLDRGYRVAVWRDSRDSLVTDFLQPLGDRAMVITGEYPGYAEAVNLLQKAVFSRDRQCHWIVTGGDDTEPDPNHTPEEIAVQCALHFCKPVLGDSNEAVVFWSGSFGVMQPTGDRFAGGAIDRVAGSPWIGREFCRRMYGGAGPYWHEYQHMFVDEEIQEVAVKLGVFWQRPDLTHHHQHFMRVGTTNAAKEAAPPAHLVQANSPGHWQFYRGLFQGRKAAGFPGHEPIA